MKIKFAFIHTEMTQVVNELCQQWLRQWLAAFWCEVIIWTDTDLLPIIH